MPTDAPAASRSCRSRVLRRAGGEQQPASPRRPRGVDMVGMRAAPAFESAAAAELDLRAVAFGCRPPGPCAKRPCASCAALLLQQAADEGRRCRPLAARASHRSLDIGVDLAPHAFGTGASAHNAAGLVASLSLPLRSKWRCLFAHDTPRRCRPLRRTAWYQRARRCSNA